MLHSKPSELPEKKKLDMPAIEAGTYPARIAKLIYLGVQEEEGYQTKDLVQKSKLMVFFELPSETFEREDDNGKTETLRRSLIKEYNVPDAYNEKSALILLFEAICGSDEGYEDMAGRPLLVEVGHTSSGNPKIVNASKVVKGMQVEELASDPVVCLEFEEDILENEPEFIRLKVAERVGD